jgi:hypothetical protein
MKKRIRVDTRLLEKVFLLQRMEEGRGKPKPAMLARAERYNRAAAELGMTFENAVAAGKLQEITAAADAPRAAPTE